MCGKQVSTIENTEGNRREELQGTPARRANEREGWKWVKGGKQE